jgi:hypothetical protein
MRQALFVLICTLSACGDAAAPPNTTVAPAAKSGPDTQASSVWYTPEKSGHVSDDGREARLCTRADFTPEEFALEARSAGWQYKITEIATDDATGKPTVVHFTLMRPGQPDTNLLFYRDQNYCKRHIALTGEKVIDLDRYK